MHLDELDEIFLSIDSVEIMIREYTKFFERDKIRKSHSIFIHGDTGCGKSKLCKQYIKVAKEKLLDDIMVLDLSEDLCDTEYNSQTKLEKTLQIIEHQIKKKGAYQDLEGLSLKPEIFKIELENILSQKDKILLICLPKIEVYEEFKKYYAYLKNKNTILYFITDQTSIIDNCKKEYNDKVSFFECTRLKKGDGKLFIDTVFSAEDELHFSIDDIESIMGKRPENSRMTISQLINICNNAYSYAKKNKINTITKQVILDDLASRNII